MSEGPGLSLLSLEQSPVEQLLSHSAHTGLDNRGKRQKHLLTFKNKSLKCDWKMQYGLYSKLI